MPVKKDVGLLLINYIILWPNGNFVCVSPLIISHLYCDNFLQALTKSFAPKGYIPLQGLGIKEKDLNLLNKGVGGFCRHFVGNH